MIREKWGPALLVVALTLGGTGAVWAATGLPQPEKSVIFIRSVSQEFDYVTPWKTGSMQRSSGTGFIIAGKRILTNAHNVSNNRYVELKKEDSARRYPGRILFVGHDCDLAVLTVDDDNFFTDTTPLEIAGIPNVNTTVSTYGFPVGGERISVTEGVVSRIENDAYAHTAADSHLVIQTDAAINPGNSGGPVIQDERVVGVAFQGLREAENIGYMIPTTVVEHFLEDIEDGRYSGFGSMGMYLYPGLHNDSYRDYLGVPEGEDGIVITGTIMNSSIENVLRANDVLTQIDAYNVDDDGVVTMYGLRLNLSEVVESKQLGETVDLVFYRAGGRMTATATIALNRPVLERARQYDTPPRYVCFGGLVFVPVTRNYLETWGRNWPERIPFGLRYLMAHSAQLNTDRQRKEYVVLSEIMPDEVNAYAGEFKSLVVESINDTSVQSLDDVYSVFEQTTEGFCVIRFIGEPRVFPVDADKAHRRQPSILEKYSIPAEAYLGEDT